MKTDNQIAEAAMKEWPEAARTVGLSLDECFTTDAEGGDKKPCQVWSIDLDGIEIEADDLPGDEWKGAPERVEGVSMCPPQLAVAMCRDSGLLWLADSGHQPMLIPRGDRPCVQIVRNGDTEEHYYLTWLGAIDGAVRAAMK